jgi:hypothetical protein
VILNRPPAAGAIGRAHETVGRMEFEVMHHRKDISGKGLGRAARRTVPLP